MIYLLCRVSKGVHRVIAAYMLEEDATTAMKALNIANHGGIGEYYILRIPLVTG